ncbi:MAG: hypothetical protein M5U28_05995 [Sandaracinaceae bacterium]|nr:hypothetical protein [Sandaracinaceae bacterium]
MGQRVELLEQRQREAGEVREVAQAPPEPIRVGILGILDPRELRLDPAGQPPRGAAASGPRRRSPRPPR